MVWDVYEVRLVRRCMLTRMTTRGPSVKTLQPLHTYTLGESPTGWLVTTR